ncbi:nicotinamide-nucleotide amidohydrolase family protein [Bacteriovoracaceae bacterium]|nr:nicotinamide-nucleotide amidohydrolase family protein [Bacteriovoracaceae bacterium]
MKFAFLAIGNELLTGKISDKNGSNLARVLRKNHLELELIQILPDQKSILIQTIQSLWKEGFNLIISGGLGPTQDDITKECLAQAFEKEIIKSQEAVKMTEDIYRSKNRTYNNETHSYHMLPQDFQATFNKVGFAPGLYFQEQQQFVMALPGVPMEFESMVEHFFQNQFASQNQNTIKETFSLHTMKIPESKIFHELAPDLWKDLNQFGTPFSLPHTGWVEVGVYLEKSSQQEIDSSIEKLLKIISKTKIAPTLWQCGHLTPAQYLVDYLTSKNCTISFQESATGGLVSHLITSIPGASNILNGSLISYTNQVKQNLLNIPSKILTEKSEVSTDVAEKMTEEGLKLFNTDFAASITGIAGPSTNDHNIPVGTAFINIRHKSGLNITDHIEMKGTREKNIHFFANRVLLNCIEFIHSFYEEKVL